MDFDVVIIGGGVIGCTIARAILMKSRNLRVCIIEKEQQLSQHQSGRNSGVIHVGYNQKPGTLKAKLIVEGSKMLKEYCRGNDIPLFEGGILVVATSERELEVLKELFYRGQQNGADVRLLDKKQVKEIEPYANGIAGLHAPGGASFDSKIFVQKVAQEVKSLNASIFLSEKVVDLVESGAYVFLKTNKGEYRTKFLINCAGLQADRIAHKLGVGLNYCIIPFKGEYYELVLAKRHLVRSHIYPTPNLKFPFLGVHISKKVRGQVIVGPGAVLALGRECYEKYSFNVSDTCEMLSSRIFWRMFLNKNFRCLMNQEIKKSVSKKVFLCEAKKLVAEIEMEDLKPYPSGIRAQLVSRDGIMVDDLCIERTKNSIHILNAVSPALTCSLSFAAYITDNLFI